jgi:hypothetical protein
MPTIEDMKGAQALDLLLFGGVMKDDRHRVMRNRQERVYTESEADEIPSLGTMTLDSSTGRVTITHPRQQPGYVPAQESYQDQSTSSP